METSPLKRVALTWISTALGVALAAALLPGISYRAWTDLLAASALLALMHSLLRPLLVFFTLPLVLVSLGLSYFLINALLLWLAGRAIDGLSVSGFWSSLFGGLIVSLVQSIANITFGLHTSNPRKSIDKSGPPSPPSHPGPVIDV